jgi:hypothetical protein
VSHEPSHTVGALHDELLAHVGGRLHDDAALLLIRKPAARPAGAEADAAAPETNVLAPVPEAKCCP